MDRMEFWGVEVKVGETRKVDPMKPENAYIHISQVALGEPKKVKANEPVVLYIKVGDQKVVLGTLNRDDTPHLSMDLILDSESELSHTSKSASVFFCGYKVLIDDDEDSEFSDSEEDDDGFIGLHDGIPEIKVEDKKDTKPSKPVPLVGASAKQANGVVPKKEEEDESDDDTADENDSGSSDEIGDDSDSDEENESDEETPEKKVNQGKKRPNESASKTPVSAKKAKKVTPEKIDDKKSVHVATPYPTKKGGKTPNSAKGQSPKSAEQLCTSCKKSFNSEAGLQQHKKSKHGGQ